MQSSIIGSVSSGSVAGNLAPIKKGDGHNLEPIKKENSEGESMKPQSGLKAIGEYVGRTPNTIRRWIKDRSFPASWVAERWYALPEKINAWLAAQEWQDEAPVDEAQAKT
jgi:hypothetical protein